MNAIIYIRNNKTSEEPTIEEQRNACRKHAAKQGITIVDEYITDDMLTNKTNLVKLVKQCQVQNISIVLAYSDKAVAYPMPNLAQLRVDLMRQNMSLICVNHTTDPSTLLLEEMLMNFIEWQRAEHSEKVKRGMQLAKERKAAQAAAEGKPVA